MFASRKDLFAVGRRAIVETPNTRINPAVVDIPGSDVNLVVGVASVIGEEVLSRGAMAMRGAFVELARGAQLDRVAADRYGLVRFGASPATVQVVLSRATPGAPTPGTYSAGSVIQTAGGVQFATDSDATFGNYTTSVTVDATALVAGLDGNVVAGTITGFSTAPFDATISITNPSQAAGGNDAESDIQFLGRIRAFFPTVRRATLGAIEYGAKQVPGVAVATAIEIDNPTASMPAGVVQLVVGDFNGNASPQMLQAVSDELLNWRAGGMPVIVVGGTVVYQSVQWQLAFITGTDEALATSRVRAVTVAVSQFLPPGPTRGKLYRSALIAAAKNVPGIVLNDSSLLYPLGDVVPSSVSEMIRVLPTSVTFVAGGTP